MSDLKIIAHIHTDFPEKFGVPRQSGLVPELKGEIIFEPEYRSIDALKGLTEYTHLWLLWLFDVPESETFQATVRPPRLGGNESMGVFATRSPFRPNPIGLSSVKLEEVKLTDKGPVIVVSGVDLRDNTKIIDIKPYLAYVDSHTEASNGFAEGHRSEQLAVDIPYSLLSAIPSEKRDALKKVLSEDPRPHYQHDSARIYGLSFAGFNIKFSVIENTLTVLDIIKD